MPNYDYHCTQCGHTLEAFQNMKDAPLLKCPSCQKDALKRGPGGGIGLQFQGSGFYITDYNSNSSPDSKNKKTDSPNQSSSCCPCGKKSSCSSE